MKLDRALQHRILNDLADRYPLGLSLIDQNAWGPIDHTITQMQYLREHGLIESTHGYYQNAKPYFGDAVVTARGLDFLSDDGGVGAILGVVTVRLHDDTIKALVAQRIDASDLPETEKQRYAEALRELPGEATKHLVLKLVDLGLDAGPKAIELIGQLL
jgi:hypothetical protein